MLTVPFICITHMPINCRAIRRYHAPCRHLTLRHCRTLCRRTPRPRCSLLATMDVATPLLVASSPWSPCTTATATIATHGLTLLPATTVWHCPCLRSPPPPHSRALRTTTLAPIPHPTIGCCGTALHHFFLVKIILGIICHRAATATKMNFMLNLMLSKISGIILVTNTFSNLSILSPKISMIKEGSSTCVYFFCA